ncbi:MAG TPA: hypothetical protein VIG46_06845 [Candidatus Baltobacteraceae bacterium]|jgi:hypothetical protein
MNAGAGLLDLALRDGAAAIAVVGTGKNAGKTVTTRALLEALRGRCVGLTSIGRDGEAVDIGDASSKPRLRLEPGTIVATARAVLPVSPASEILDTSDLMTAAGPLLYARVRMAAQYELLGAPTASGVRASLDRMRALGAEVTLLDGAVDRVAALAGGDEAIVVATGAATAATVEEAVDDVRALVARLALPVVDEREPALRIDGALTATMVAAFAARGETRQIVVGDPTRIALAGRAFDGAMRRLTLRCERPLRVVAVTVASIGTDRYFEPAGFARAVAAATGLPTFDVYAGARAA